MTDKDAVSALGVWRQSIDFDRLEWREVEQRGSERREERRTQRRRDVSRRDRKTFGEETWGVSQAHRTATTREELLKQRDLPVLHSELELAQWLGLSLGRLRWFTHDKPADPVWHYVKYTIPKRSGGTRVILAPKPELKALQRKILRDILDKVKPHPAAHGFVAGHSIATHARRHIGKGFVLRIDLKDFFPTITFPRVRGLFTALGYSFSVASTLALLCTEHDREGYEDTANQLERGNTVWVSVGPRGLVQGAPTSPALANLVVRHMDGLLRRFASERGFSYSRYADDLTFSGDKLETLLYILAETQKVIAQEGFTVNRDKTLIQRRSSQQRVTGLVVNDAANVPRRVRRRLRAILHNAAQTGLDTQNREGRENFRAYLQGMIGFINETNPREAERLAQSLKALKSSTG